MPPLDSGEPDEVNLPPRVVLDAGVAKFAELAKLHWPSKEDGFKLTSFDFKNAQQIRMTLGLVYLAMLDAAVGKNRGPS